MTLNKILAKRIKAQGSISVAEFMEECLLHPEFGYYTKRDPFGRHGDFITAPEISQMFGELIGLSLAQAWMNQGQSGSFTLAEAGPGRGTLMVDVLRATRNIPGFQDAAQLVLIEASDHLRTVQARTLKDHNPTWIKHIEDLPEQPLFLIANEFFDALPIRQFQRDRDQWRERHIHMSSGKLAFTHVTTSNHSELTKRLIDTKDGDIIESRPDSQRIVATIGTRINRYGGSALIIDYGNWRSHGDTLQAVKQHQWVHPLSAPGESDLTSHVDFEALALDAVPCKHSELTSQRIFLKRLGIDIRAQQLAQNAHPTKKKEIFAAYDRLTHPDQCGHIFKVLGLFPEDEAPPPGLTE